MLCVIRQLANLAVIILSGVHPVAARVAKPPDHLVQSLVQVEGLLFHPQKTGLSFLQPLKILGR